MALQKTITLRNGQSGNYVRLSSYRWDRLTREASAHFCLHASKELAEAAPDAPIVEIATVRLNGPKFDEYLGNAALSAPGVTLAGQLYRAAKSEPILPGGGFNRDQLTLSDSADV